MEESTSVRHITQLKVIQGGLPCQHLKQLFKYVCDMAADIGDLKKLETSNSPAHCG